MSAAAKLSASTVPAAFAVQIIETRMVVKGRFKTMAAATFASWKHGECKGGLVAQPVGLDAASNAYDLVYTGEQSCANPSGYRLANRYPTAIRVVK